jgi:hypothetical protein
MSLLRGCPFLFFKEKETTSNSQWTYLGVIEEFRIGLAQVCKGTGGAEVEGSSCPREDLEGVKGSGVRWVCSTASSGADKGIGIPIPAPAAATNVLPSNVLPLELVIPY